MTALDDRLVDTVHSTSLPVDGPARTVAAPAGKLHRTVALVALLSLFIGTHDAWLATIWTFPGVAITLSVAYGLILVTGVAVLAVRGSRAMVVVDVAVLLLALMVRLPVFLSAYLGNLPTYLNDEGPLVDFAGKLLALGQNPYTVVWPGAYAPDAKGITLTMAGGVVDRYDYPPLAALLNYAFRPIPFGVSTAALAAMTAVVVACVLMFVLLPRPWRSAAPMVCLGFSFLPSLASDGYPSALFLPFVVVAVAGWARIGTRRGVLTGQLGWRGWGSALALGLAADTQQLAWFLVPYLVIGLAVVRAGDLGWPRAARLVGAYVAVMVGAILAVNGPFMVDNFGAWWTGITTPLAVPTILHGQGLVGITFYLVGGSGDLQLYAVATVASMAATLALLVLFPRRLAPALVAFPWAIFYVATRSQDTYFVLMAPIWLMAVATVSHHDVAGAWEFRPVLRGWRLPPDRPWRLLSDRGWRVLPDRGWRLMRGGGWSPLHNRPVQALIGLALFVPSALFVTGAITSPPPLRMSVVWVGATRTSHLINLVEVNVTNVSDRTITPHFALSSSSSISRFWSADTGPAALAPHETALYVLVPSQPNARRRQSDRVVLRAVSDNPLTLSSVALTRPDDNAGTGGGRAPRKTF